MSEGYQIGAFARPWTKFGWEDYLSSVAACGYKYMGFMRHAEAELLPGLEQDRVAAIRESLERHGLTPTTELSLHHTTTRCPLRHGVDFAVQEACRQIDVMAAVGVRYYLSCGTPDEMLYETLFTVLREAAAYGQDKGVTVTVRSHGGPVGTCLDLVRAVEIVDHPNFGIYYDPGNILYFTGGDPLENLSDVAAHVVAVCVKDEVGGLRGDVNIEPGTGNVDFEAVCGTLKAGGFESGPVMVECLGGDELQDIDARGVRVRRRLEQWLK